MYQIGAIAGDGSPCCAPVRYRCRPATGQKGAQTIRSAIEHIDTHLHEYFSLTDIAAAVGMSPNFLSTLWGYISDKPIGTAIRLLTDKHCIDSMLEIATRSDYITPPASKKRSVRLPASPPANTGSCMTCPRESPGPPLPGKGAPPRNLNERIPPVDLSDLSGEFRRLFSIRIHRIFRSGRRSADHPGTRTARRQRRKSRVHTAFRPAISALPGRHTGEF